jgi:hypothetical protein
VICVGEPVDVLSRRVEGDGVGELKSSVTAIGHVNTSHVH